MSRCDMRPVSMSARALSTAILFSLAVPALAWAGEKPAPLAGVVLTDVDGKKHELAAPEGTRATVVFFLGVECPATQKYSARMAALARELGPKSVRFLGVNANAL